MVHIGDTVKWASGHKPLGVVVHKFTYKDKNFAVVERTNNISKALILNIVRIYEQLEVVSSLSKSQGD